jgi:hypothetical protein
MRDRELEALEKRKYNHEKPNQIRWRVLSRESCRESRLGLVVDAKREMRAAKELQD